MTIFIEKEQQNVSAIPLIYCRRAIHLLFFFILFCQHNSYYDYVRFNKFNTH